MSVAADSTQSKDQVALFNLLFGMSWEDPAADRLALRIQPGETLMTVTSGGCNTLTLLLEDPGRIYTVDINPTQSYLLELKRAAIRHLDYDELHAFLGVKASAQRQQIFERLRGDLSDAAQQYWIGQPEAIRNGVIHAGKYESFVRLFSRVVRLIQGKKRIEGLFACETLEQQQAYFEARWNTVQWRWLFRVLVSKRILARRGLTVDYFKFDDGSSSFSESFLRRGKRAICEIPARSNYFLALYLAGDYRSEDAVPEYLLRKNLPVVRQRLDRVEIVTAPAQAWLAERPDGSIDNFSLSNICELMSLEETGRLFAEVARSGRQGARICFRNLMIPRGVPENMASSIEIQADLSRDLLAQDRSFVYSRVQAFVVNR